MNENSLLERLVQVSPGMEIWWDSSPVIFENWCRKLLAKAQEGDRETLKRQFARMYDGKSPDAWLFRGVTTNPSLSLQAIKDDEPYWKDVTKGIIKANPGIDKESLFWLLYKEIVRRGSEMFLPLFEKSGYREGYLSGQVDPRKCFDRDTMLKQADDLAAINPNVMIKVPGTKEGYEVIHFPRQENITFEKGRIDRNIPKETLEKLLRIPYFERAYAEDGYSRDEYKSHPSLIKTAEQFGKATDDMVAFAGKCLDEI